MRAFLLTPAFLLAFAIPTVAHADTVTFTLTLTGGASASFTLDSSAVGSTGFGGVEYDDIDLVGVSPDNFVDFFDANFDSINGLNDGPVNLEIFNPDSGFDEAFDGRILFTGDESDPVFRSGLYELHPAAPLAGPNYTESGTLLIDNPSGLPAAAPEPSSLMLFGTGVLGCVGVIRRRFVKA